MKIFTNYGISNINNNHQSFKQKTPKVIYVKEKLRKTGADEAFSAIFGDRIKEAKTLIRSLIEGTGSQRTDGLRLKAVDRQTSLITDSSNNLLLSIYKTTHFGEHPAVSNSYQAIKLNSYELKGADKNTLQRIDVYHNYKGRYKVELYDGKGQFTDEFLGLKNYTADNSYNHIKPAKNNVLGVEGYEHVKYYPESKTSSYIERDSYDSYGNKTGISIPLYENGKFIGYKCLSPKRKLIRTLSGGQMNESRSFDWISYSKRGK